MMFQETEIRERENDFYKNIIRLYLKYGSVDEVFRVTNYDLPISYPGMHHLIKRWGIIKSAGPNSKLSETLTFLTLLSDNQIPLVGVDYESINPKGNRFWFKHFLPYTYSLVRRIDERILDETK